VRIHRPLDGTLKTVSLSREADGWSGSASCAQVPIEQLPLAGRETGIDVGVKVFGVTAEGEPVENPLLLPESQEETQEGSTPRLSPQEGQ
jgi:putative transposase